MELMVIMTPHIVRCAQDRDRILFEESKRMDWVLGDVARIQGTTGMGPVFSPVPPPGGALLHDPMSAPVWSDPPAPSTLLPSPVPGAPSQEALPQPRTMPQARPAPSGTGPMPQSRAPSAAPASMASFATLPPATDTTGTPVSVASQPGTSQPQAWQPSDGGPSTSPEEPPKEKRGWSLLPWRK